MKPNPCFLWCGLTLVTAAAGRVLYPMGPYLAGRQGYDTDWQQYETTWMVLVGICLGISVFSALVLGFILIRRIALEQVKRKTVLWEALLFTALIATTWSACLGSRQPAYQYFLDGFSAFAGGQESLPEIQRWSRDLKLPDGFVSEKEWPRSVEALEPASVSVETNGGNREISLTWGGGFFHWGLTLRGNPNGLPQRTGQEIRMIDASTYVWADSR